MTHEIARPLHGIGRLLPVGGRPRIRHALAARGRRERGGYEFIEGESLLVEVDDQPGGMARVARRLADAGVNIYGHLFIGRWGDQAQFSFVVSDVAAARKALEGLSSIHAG